MNKFIMMVGLPASGKDYWIKEYLNSITMDKYIVLSSDSIREELYGDEAIQGDPNEVFSVLHKRLKSALIRGENIIYNATNITVKNRKQALQIVKPFDDYLIFAEIMATTLGQCLENNKNRERKVPEYVIKRMYRQWEPPCYFEGFNRIEVNYPFIKPYIKYNEKIKELKKLPHDNPHHHLNVGTHMLAAARLCRKDIKSGKVKITEKPRPELEAYYDDILIKALKLHDIGKELTKEFKDSKGNPSNIAHFYDHANVGAYEYMFYLMDRDYYVPFGEEYEPIVGALIAHHMRPHSWKEKKTKEKYRREWGEVFYNLITYLNYYDRKSEEN